MKAQKFKAWDGQQKRWLLEFDFAISGDGEVYLYTRSISEDGFFHLAADLGIVEYTGKTDKEGNEIYAGDILKCEDKLYPLLLGVYLVEWSDEECGFICERQEPYTYLLPGVWCKCEIVGNIFENPELLKETKK